MAAALFLLAMLAAGGVACGYHRQGQHGRAAVYGMLAGVALWIAVWLAFAT